MEKLLLKSVKNTKKKDLSYDSKVQEIVDKIEHMYSKKPLVNSDNHSRVVLTGKHNTSSGIA